MKEIIEPVNKELLVSELTKEKFLRKTNYGNNELYIVTHHDSPNVMREIGRVREITFREAGGGTGKDMDIDSYDTCANPYKQLIVWDPEEKNILGGYRFFNCAEFEYKENGEVNLATAGLFNFSKEFIEDYLPHIIELGRSFVVPEFQSTKSKRLYVLDNLWDGLGAIWVNLPKTKYFFGKVTMYTDYNQQARNYLLYFLQKYFGDKEDLLEPLEPLNLNIDENEMNETFIGANYDEDYKILSQKVRSLGETIPPLINSYMNLSSTMKCFGTVINHHFGYVEETAIMVSLDDLYEAKSERHVKSFVAEEQGFVF